MSTSHQTGSLCILGDVHGHLQLGLSLAALWQRTLEVQFEAVLLCGDVGTFTEDSQLDSATRNFARRNSCELEFMNQWMQYPQPAWLSRIFEPVSRGGLGLECPVVMAHGNHEGFEHLSTLFRPKAWERDVPLRELPAVDAEHHLRYLPSGWTARTASGIRIGAVGGIEPHQRRAKYHELAYLNEDAVLQLLMPENRVDVLITHQGPAEVQGDHGSETLQMLLDAEVAGYWFHGHSCPVDTIAAYGPNGRTTVVPLHDVGFGHPSDDPGQNGHCWLCPGERRFLRDTPPCWRDFRRKHWTSTPEGLLVSPVVK